MAVVNSLAIGKAVKSAGNLTYKVSRGRTIASQRITSNNSDTMPQRAQRNKFGRASIAMQLLGRYIDMMFEKSKYGSSRNNFVKKNGLIDMGSILFEVQASVKPLIDGFAYVFECNEDRSPVPGAATYTSFGSGPFLVNERTSHQQYVDSSRNNIFVRKCLGLTVNPTTGVDVSKIEVRVAGFNPVEGNPNPPMFVRSIVPDAAGIQALTALGLSCTVVTDEGSNVVTSIGIEMADSPASALDGSLYAVTVAVAGKLATTTGLWFIVSESPLP